MKLVYLHSISNLLNDCHRNMKRNIYKILFALSVLLNLSLGVILLWNVVSNNTSEEKETTLDIFDMVTLQSKAEVFARNTICETLYYPRSYDPVNTTVDSVFYNYLTDSECVQAAEELIDLRGKYSSALSRYNDAVNHIKFHGMTDLGTFHWGKDRDAAKVEMKELQEKIDRRKSIIKNRNTSNDGNFIGWQVAHRYRASNSDGVVSFGDVLFVMDKTMENCYFKYQLEDNNSKSLRHIRETIEKELGIFTDL